MSFIAFSPHSLSEISKLSGANIALDTIPEKNSNNNNITMVQKQQRIPHKTQTISEIQSEQKEPQNLKQQKKNKLQNC